MSKASHSKIFLLLRGEEQFRKNLAKIAKIASNHRHEGRDNSKFSRGFLPLLNDFLEKQNISEELTAFFFLKTAKMYLATKDTFEEVPEAWAHAGQQFLYSRKVLEQSITSLEVLEEIQIAPSFLDLIDNYWQDVIEWSEEVLGFNEGEFFGG